MNTRTGWQFGIRAAKHNVPRKLVCLVCPLWLCSGPCSAMLQVILKHGSGAWQQECWRQSDSLAGWCPAWQRTAGGRGQLIRCPCRPVYAHSPSLTAALPASLGFLLCTAWRSGARDLRFATLPASARCPKQG